VATDLGEKGGEPIMIRFTALVIVAMLLAVPASVRAQDPIAKMIQELGLNQNQIAQIKQLIEAFAKNQDSLPTVGDVLMQNREGLRDVITVSPFDQAMAQQIAHQVASVVAQRMMNRLELRNQIFQVLTPQQQEKYVKTVQEALIESR
jgi:Spy/CpxP family protein refolding chaperone